MKAFVAANIKIIGIVSAVIVLGGTFLYLRANQAPSFGNVTVGRGTVVASVHAGGTVRAEASADLSFEEAGEIARVNVKEGDAVSSGEVLAALDASALTASLQGADGALAATQAHLDALTAGTRPEELAIAQNAAASAESALTDAIGSAYTSADDAVKNQTDNLFMNPQTNSPMFVIPVKDTQTQIDIQAQRGSVGIALKNFYAAVSANIGSTASLSSVADAALAQVKSYLDAVALAVNNAVPNSGVPATTLAAYKANVVVARSEVIASVAALTSAESALSAAQGKLALAQAGATPQDIEAAKAVVLQAQAAETGAKVALSRASLVALFPGTVQNLTAKVGQVVAPGTPMLSLVNNNGLKIEVFVSQGDIANVKEGQKAEVTLDAYGTKTVFPATVTTVGAGQTAVNGAPSYKVTLHFTNPDSRVKDGMSANVHIVTAESADVLEVPTRFLINDGGRSYVIVSTGSGSERREVTTGITGDDGMTEIASGLAAGDRVIAF